MIKIKKNINIDSSFPIKDNIATVNLSNLHSQIYFNKSTENDIKVKNNDIIYSYLTITNLTGNKLNDILFTMNSNNFSKVIVGSLRNAITKVKYINQNNSNTISLGKLDINESIEIQFAMKIDLSQMSTQMFRYPINLLSNNNDLGILAHISQAVINVYSQVFDDKIYIKIQNTGTTVASNIIYSHELPICCEVDNSAITYSTKDITCELLSPNITKTLIFKIDNLQDSISSFSSSDLSITFKNIKHHVISMNPLSLL